MWGEAFSGPGRVPQWGRPWWDSPCDPLLPQSQAGEGLLAEDRGASLTASLPHLRLSAEKGVLGPPGKGEPRCCSTGSCCPPTPVAAPRCHWTRHWLGHLPSLCEGQESLHHHETIY